MLCQVIVVGSTTKSRFFPNCCCCAAAASSSASSSGLPLLAGSEDSGAPRLEATNRTVRATAAVASTATTLGGTIFLLLEQRHRRSHSRNVVTEEAAKEKLGNGSLSGGGSRNKWGTACAHKHTRNPHILSLSLSLSLSVFQTRALLSVSPFFPGYVSPKSENEN